VARQLGAQAGGVQDGLTSTVGARNRAGRIDPEEIPSRERRGRPGAESTQSCHRRRDYPAMLPWLEQAYQA
jgi:hypothetical protein